MEYNKKGDMIVETGFKEFDKQTNLITTGNVISNTQNSLYIRAKKEIECNGEKFKEGYLMEWDLSCFGNIPYYIKNFIVEIGGNCYLYHFFTHRKNKKIGLCWIVLNKENNKILMSKPCFAHKQNHYKRLLATLELEKILLKKR